MSTEPLKITFKGKNSWEIPHPLAPKKPSTVFLLVMFLFVFFFLPEMHATWKLPWSIWWWYWPAWWADTRKQTTDDVSVSLLNQGWVVHGIILKAKPKNLSLNPNKDGYPSLSKSNWNGFSTTAVFMCEQMHFFSGCSLTLCFCRAHKQHFCLWWLPEQV